jgi:undecaprenyl-diphosphatase
MAFFTAVGLFAILAVVVASNPPWLARLDTTVSSELAATQTGILNRVMFGITLLGNRIVIGTLLAVVTVWALRTGRCRTPVLVMIGAFLVNPALEALLKGLVGRDRPDIARVVAGTGPAFPSGHVLATVGFYGILALIVWRSTTRRALAVGVLSTSAVIIAVVGFSRIYLGVHWMSDVVGGLLVGAAFVMAAAYFLKGHHFGRVLRCAADGCRWAADHVVRVPSSRAR